MVGNSDQEGQMTTYPGDGLASRAAGLAAAGSPEPGARGRPGADPELLEYTLGVVAGRMSADPERLCDRRVRETFGKELGHLHLAAGEAVLGLEDPPIGPAIGEVGVLRRRELAQPLPQFPDLVQRPPQLLQ